MAYTSDDDALLWDGFEVEEWYAVPGDLSSRQVKHLPEDLDDLEEI